MNVEVELKDAQDDALPLGTRAIRGKTRETIHIFNQYGAHVCWIDEGDIGNYCDPDKFSLAYFRKWGSWEAIDIEKVVVRKRSS